MSRERVGSGQHYCKRDLAVSLQIPSTVGLLTRAFPDQMIDAVAADEKRALGKSNIHSTQIVALTPDSRTLKIIRTQVANVREARGLCLGVEFMIEVPAQRRSASGRTPCHAAGVRS